ncbi:hypothetical protein [Erythrobacter sp. Dej080120_24]|uniref:hypothetical protein n=1 Tax=Erythrobacter sp. Dej080120_24 TaxID=3024837 RepID=UPI0030C77EEE
MAEADDEGPAVRKEALLLCFKEAVRDVFGFRYAADVDVRHGSKDRTLYFLVYGTREPAGIEVLRECQVKALEAQAEAASQRTQGKLVEDGIGFYSGRSGSPIRSIIDIFWSGSDRMLERPYWFWQRMNRVCFGSRLGRGSSPIMLFEGLMQIRLQVHFRLRGRSTSLAG